MLARLPRRYPVIIGRLANFLLFPLALMLMHFSLSADFALAAETDFPIYPEISDSVRFWEKIYSEYTLSQGVVHDRNDLSVIYAMVNLARPTSRESERANRRRVEVVKERYRRILHKLAIGGKPSGFEERRVLHLFGPNPSRRVLENAVDNIRMQIGQRGRFRQGMIRAGAHIETIRAIFREYDLPEELAYLIHVESSFNQKARSRAGAVGLWQFTRGTGQNYLAIGAAVDERCDPLKATRGAAEFLRDNYLELGSWPLAITAYNYGQNGMKRAVLAQGDFPSIIREYDGKSFGFASRNFYAEFLAAKRVAENYRDYFGELPIEKPVTLYRMPLEGFIDARQLAGYLNIDLETIKRYNPDLSRGAILGKKLIPAGYQLQLPLSFGRELLRVGDIPRTIFRTVQKDHLFHKVREGETVYDIARRYKVEVEELLYANQISSESVIFAGQNLRIPRIYGPPDILLTGIYKVAVRNASKANNEQDV